MYNVFGLGRSILRLRVTTRLPFTPSALFGPSDTGWFYDNSDFSTMFQDSAGTTPVTAVGQPVGLQLDKSKGLVLGPELVTNGTFDTDLNGWFSLDPDKVALSWEDGAVRVVANSATFGGIVSQSFPTVAGRTYQVSAQILSNTGNGALIFSQTSTGGATTAIAVNAQAGIYSGVFRATTESSRIGIVNTNSATSSRLIDNVSVRELPGNHRSQSISLNRPILARHPLGGIRNLLTFSEQFDNAAWAKTNATASGQRVTANAGDHAAYVGRQLPDRPASSHAITVAFAPAAGRHRYVWLGDRGTVPVASATFDLDTATVVGQNAGVTPVVETLPDGSVSCSIVYARTTVGTSSPQFAFAGASHTSDRPSLTWLGGEFLDAKAQFELGSTATAYQKVTTAYDVTEAGVPDQYYLSYNGTNNSLATSAFDWGSDKATVVAGVRKLSDAAIGVVTEFGASVSGNPGSVGMFAPAATSGVDAQRVTFVSRGSTGAVFIRPIDPIAAPVTAVVSGLGNISGDLATLRINGTQVAQSTADQGTGNFGTYQTFFGARGGTSLFFNGYEYSQFAINRLLTESELALVERYTNSRTGAY